MTLSESLFLSLIAIIFALGCLHRTKTDIQMTSVTNKIEYFLLDEQTSYKQGMTVLNGVIYQSTGLRSRSQLSILELQGGQIKSNEKYLAPSNIRFNDITEDGKGLYILLGSGDKLLYISKLRQKPMEIPLTHTQGLQPRGIAADKSTGLLYISFQPSVIYRFTDFKSSPTEVILRTSSGVPIDRTIASMCFVENSLWVVFEGDNSIGVFTKAGAFIKYLELEKMRIKSQDIKIQKAGRPLREDETLSTIAFDEAARAVYLGGINWPILFRINL